MDDKIVDDTRATVWRVISQATVELHEIEYRGLRLAVWRADNIGSYLASCYPFFSDIHLKTAELSKAKEVAIIILRQEATRLLLKAQVLGTRARRLSPDHTP